MPLDEALQAARTTEELEVCADLLLEAGEPQGAVMAAQLAGGTSPQQEELEALLRRVLGVPALPAEGSSRLQFEWGRGFVTGLRWRGWDGFRLIEESFLEVATLLDTPPVLVPAMRWSPGVTAGDRLRAWRVLCRLETLHVGPWISQPDYSQWWDLVASLGLPSSVRHLVCDDVPWRYSDEHQLTWVDLGDLSELWSRFALGESLSLRGSRPVFGHIDAPALRRFDLETSTLTTIEPFLSARWPRLEHFSICFHDGRYSDEVWGVGDALAVLSALPASVRSVGLRNTPFTEPLLEALAASPRLPTLTALDLSDGVLLEGAPMLERLAHAFSHLERLDVSDTGLLIDEGLRARLPNLVDTSEGRRKAHRYVSLSE